MTHIPLWAIGLFCAGMFLAGVRLLVELDVRANRKAFNANVDAEHEPCVKKSYIGANGDPLNLPPKTIKPILFADGFRVTVDGIHELGLYPIIDGDGRIVMLMTATGKHVQTVEEWCGLCHGARIS